MSENVIPFKKPGEEDETFTPIELLKAAIADIEEGRVDPRSIFIGIISRHPTKPHVASLPYYTMGLSPLELRGLLAYYMTEVSNG